MRRLLGNDEAHSRAHLMVIWSWRIDPFPTVDSSERFIPRISWINFTYASHEASHVDTVAPLRSDNNAAEKDGKHV